MHLMMVVFTTLLEGFQVHFQTLAEEVVLAVVSEVEASAAVVQAEVGKQ